MKTVYIIILATVVFYLIGGYIMYIGWPRVCNEGQTSDSLDPIQVNDAIQRDCESVWSHYYPSTDQADRTKWTQLVIDLATSGKFNCWDSSTSNNIIVKEILETSNPSCNTGDGMQNEKSLNISSLINALRGSQVNRDIYRLNAMTQKQADVVNVGCADCSLSMELDTATARQIYTVEADDKCLAACDPKSVGCELNSDDCWGPCHGSCGGDEAGVEYRKWIMNTAPGSGGRQCTNLAPADILRELTVDTPFIIQDRVCVPDDCPGCCETNTEQPDDTCNKHTGRAGSMPACITQEYNSKTTASKECQWSKAGAEEDGKFFADDSLCMYLDVVEGNSSAVIKVDEEGEAEETTADQPFDMKCRWLSGTTTQGRCLPTRPITEDEEIVDRVKGKGTSCTNDSLYKDFSDTCQNGFDINNPNPSKIFALKSSGWRGVNEDPNSIRACDVKNSEDCNASDDCRWIDPHSGSCEFVKPGYMKFSDASGTEDAYKQVCKDQHAINSYIQTAYNEMNGVCEYQTTGLRISLTSIPNYGSDGVKWNSSDGAHGWLWTNFDNGGAATMEAANELLNKNVAIPNTNSTFRLSGTPILQEHPLIDGNTESASSYNVNHYSVWIPGFSVTGGATVADLKSHFDSNNFKDTKGRKIVVSNLDIMTIGSNGSVSYTENNGITLPVPEDGRIVDQRQCMIEGSVLKWRSGGADGDHPVIDGTIWKPVSRSTSVTTSKHSYNCEPLPNVTPTGDESIDVSMQSIWREIGDDASNNSNKFSGFMNSYNFSNIHPNNAGGDSSFNPSYLTEQVKKLGGVRCRDTGDDFKGKACRAKRWDLADFDYHFCSKMDDPGDCNTQKKLDPLCQWNKIENVDFDSDADVQVYCAAK